MVNEEDGQFLKFLTIDDAVGGFDGRYGDCKGLSKEYNGVLKLGSRIMWFPSLNPQFKLYIF